MMLPARTIPRWITAAALPFAALVGHAQDAVMAVPSAPVVAPSLRDAGPPDASRPPVATDAFFQIGPVSLHPELSLRAIYGLRLPAPGGRYVASMINTTSAGLSADLGEHWTVEASRTHTAYSARALADSTATSFRFQGTGNVSNWNWIWTETYRESTPLLIETGGPTPQHNWGSSLGLARAFGPHLRFQANLGLDEMYGETFPDSRDWSTMNWLTVSPNSRVQVGLGIGAAYTEIIRQPDATSERFMGRFNWKPSEKLAVSIDGGIESRSTRSLTGRDLRNPLLRASIMYRPFKATTLSLSSDRTVSNSYFQRQVNERASWSAGLNQRLLGRFYLSASYGRSTNDFESTELLTLPPAPESEIPSDNPVVISPPGRSDRVNSFNLRLSTKLFDRFAIGASYLRNQNQSSERRFSFTTTQFGVDVSVRF
jgi:hypothetical protein